MKASLKTGPVEFATLACGHFPATLMNLDAQVLEYKAVVSRSGKLVNVGNSVRIQCSMVSLHCLSMCMCWLSLFQVQHGLLVAVIAVQQQRYCIVQELETVSVNGEPILNQFDCPLLTLSTDFYAVHPDSIITSISVIHECTTSCTFKQNSSSSRIERELISQNSLVYEHDWSHNIYCLNLFCINQW